MSPEVFRDNKLMFSRSTTDLKCVKHFILLHSIYPPLSLIYSLIAVFSLLPGRYPVSSVYSVVIGIQTPLPLAVLCRSSEALEHPQACVISVLNSLSPSQTSKPPLLSNPLSPPKWAVQFPHCVGRLMMPSHSLVPSVRLPVLC